MCKLRSKKFTIVELLIIVAILGILLSLLLPGVRTAREQSLEAVCMSNTKQGLIAAYVYSKNNNMLLPFCAKQKAAGDPKYASKYSPGYWQYLVQDYVGLHFNSFWEFKAEDTIFECPMQDIVIHSGWTMLRGYAHNFHYMGYNNVTDQFSKAQTLASVEDPANTIYIGDSQDQDEVDSTRRYFRYGYIYPPHQKNFNHFRHRGGINIGWVDGHASYKKWSEVKAGKNGDSSWYWRTNKK